MLYTGTIGTLQRNNTFADYKTGFVRKYCRSVCFKTTDETGKTIPNFKYIDKIHSLNITGIEEFAMLQRAFSGGFTHANANTPMK